MMAPRDNAPTSPVTTERPTKLCPRNKLKAFPHLRFKIPVVAVETAPLSLTLHDVAVEAATLSRHLGGVDAACC